MKVLFVGLNEKKFLKNAGDRLPLGLVYVATAVEEAGYKVKVLDMNHSCEFTLKYNIKWADFVCVSMISSPSYNEALRVLQLVNNVNPKALTVIGGYHATIRPQDFDVYADFVIRGDGEEEILNVLKNRLVSVGVNYSPNFVSVPNRNLLSHKDYNMVQGGKRATTIITSRGCPYGCIYCGNYHRKVSYRDLKNIETELRMIKKQGYKSLYVLDDSFTINKQHFFAVTNLFKQYGFSYRCTTRSNLITKEYAEQLKNTGCEIVSLGIESFDNKVLKAMNKGETVEDHYKAISILNYHGIKVKGFFIFGLPKQDVLSGLKTMRLACSLKHMGLSSADFYALTPFPGSEIYDNPHKFGIKIIDTDWEHYLQAGKELLTPVIETKWMSQDNINACIYSARQRFDDE